MDEIKAGFREVPHTADIEIHVWAPDLSALLEQSAIGMYALAGTTLEKEPRETRSFEILYLDRESLIVDFLSELLFYGEDEELGFDIFQITLNHESCNIYIEGAPISNNLKEIKAVTYHGISVEETLHGLAVNIVFDV